MIEFEWNIDLQRYEFCYTDVTTNKQSYVYLDHKTSSAISHETIRTLVNWFNSCLRASNEIAT